jgi:hypothetical protein
VPEKSAAPNSTNKMLKVKIAKTLNGIASNIVGSSDTRATNHACRKNSRHAKGLRGINTNVSSAIAKKPPNEVNAALTVVDDIAFQFLLNRPAAHNGES